MAAAPVWSVDPRTGKQREQVAVEATAQEVDAAVRAAHDARGALADRTVRAAFLRTAADRLQAAKDQLVEAADAETALGPVRLTGELARTCYQLRSFADIVDEGAFLDVVINHPDDTATPRHPGSAPLQGVPRRRRRLLGVQLPLRLLRRRRRHRERARRGLPGRRQGHPHHPALSELVAAPFCGGPPPSTASPRVSSASSTASRRASS